MTSGHNSKEYILCGVILIIGISFFCLLMMAPDVLADIVLAIPKP